MSIDSIEHMEWERRAEQLSQRGAHPTENISRMRSTFNDFSRIAGISAVSVQATVSYEESVKRVALSSARASAEERVQQQLTQAPFSSLIDSSVLDMTVGIFDANGGAAGEAA